jgi:hypothetical protein
MIWTTGHEEWAGRFTWATIVCFTLAAIIYIEKFFPWRLQFVRKTSKVTPRPTEPDLRLAITGWRSFTPKPDDGTTGLIVDIRVWNLGQPSVVTKWSLSVLTKEGPAAETYPSTLQTDFPLNFNNGAISQMVRASEFIETSTCNTPISATPITGKLIFSLPFREEFFTKSVTHMELTVQDIREKRSRATQAVGGWGRSDDIRLFS